MPNLRADPREGTVYRHILVAIDDSSTSEKALHEAFRLASACGAAMEIVHAVDESLFPTHARGGVALMDVASVQRALEQEGRDVIAKAVAAAAKAGVEVSTRLLSSETKHAADQIVDAADEAQADLIVLGSHGRRGVQRLVLGSVAERVLRRSATSVLIVRAAP
jgi:nucleotide-binding universal stress UspA family protein